MSVTPKTTEKKLFDVWCEGYQATGEHQKAHLLGSVEATTFQEACKILSKRVCVRYWNEDCTRMYGCQVFDNEQDARRSYG